MVNEVVKRISLSIVTYNNGDEAGNALASIFEMCGKGNLEIYIVDNASTDDTVPSLQERFPSEEYPFLHFFLNEKNLGFGAGHNRVISHLDSQYHVVVNPDIILRDDVFARMAAYLDRHPDTVLLSPRVLFPSGREQILPKRNPFLRALAARRLPRFERFHRHAEWYEMRDQNLNLPQEIEFASGCFMFLRTEAFRKAGGFDERYFMYFEDADLTRALCAEGKVQYDPSFVVYHRWDRVSARSFKYMMIQVFSMVKYFNKWGWKF